MQPKNFQFGGGSPETVLDPLVALAMLIAVLLILTLPREKVITPFLLAFFSIPLAQVVVLGGVHFTVLRILILTVLARRATVGGSVSEGKFAGGFNALDKVVVLWGLSALIIFSLQWMDMQALIKGLGDLVDYLGGYLAARFLIPNREAVRRTIKAMAAICFVQGACMVTEQYTFRNVYGVFGGYPPELRNGHIRSNGVLGSLYAGPFAGVLIPLFVWLWTEGKSRMAAYAGLGGATAMVWASHASTSWMAYGASLLGLGFWPMRKQMRVLRWGLVATLVGLHLVMNGPVWSLIEKIDITGGSSSAHRYMLVDNCIRHFSDWWLLGYKYYGDWGFVMFDVCNQFVLAGLRGGLVTLVIYVAIYKRSFGAIGTTRKRVEGNRVEEWYLWCLGSALFTTVVSSFGINYMIQLMMCLSPLLACISVATFESKQLSVGIREAPPELTFASPSATSGIDLRLSESQERTWHGFFEA
jgi:hypothetical protein